MNPISPRSINTGALTTESPLRDLSAIIRSRIPLIAVESNEEPQVVQLVRQIGRQFQLKAFRWTVTEGLQAFDPGDQPAKSVIDSKEILSYIKTSASNCLFVLLDFSPYLQDAVHVRFLKDIALSSDATARNVLDMSADFGYFTDVKKNGRRTQIFDL